MAAPKAMIPGAPPVRLESVAADRHHAVLQEGQRVAHGHELQLRPGGERSTLKRRSELGPPSVDPLEQHQSRVAVVPEVEAQVGFCPLFWARTAAPTHWPPLSWVEVISIWEYWSLA